MPPGNPEQERRFTHQRLAMVEEQLVRRGIRDAAVLEAMRRVPRHRFVPPRLRHQSYTDRALLLAEGQTISQPYIVARMTELLEARPGSSVLDVGTGSGYQAAVLAEMGCTVIGLEIRPALADAAAGTLLELGYAKVRVIQGDGWYGLPAEAPFDGILMAAAPTRIPEHLLDQLVQGGHLVVPVGRPLGDQVLWRVTRWGTRTLRERVLRVRFVPLTHD
jgi:protein-L-isoaspartate(D-aspartate) O-methyltransferase